MWDKLKRFYGDVLLLWRYEGFLTACLVGTSKLSRYLGVPLLPNYSEINYFDTIYGLDTSTIVDSGSLDMPAERRQHAVAYEPTSPPPFHHILSKLPVNLHDYQFIDFGSGAGRALILASAYPFRAVRGVELSQPLHELACKNIQKYLITETPCQNTASICEDVVDYKIPDGNLILYFYNPFDRVIFEQVIINIISCFSPINKIFLIYCNPKHKDFLEKTELFKVYYAGSHGQHDWLIYEMVESPRDAVDIM